MPAWLNGRGVATLQCYASADLGLIAYESPAQEGMIVDEGVVVDLVRPGTGEPVAPGEVGDECDRAQQHGAVKGGPRNWSGLIKA